MTLKPGHAIQLGRVHATTPLSLAATSPTLASVGPVGAMAPILPLLATNATSGQQCNRVGGNRKEAGWWTAQRYLPFRRQKRLAAFPNRPVVSAKPTEKLVFLERGGYLHPPGWAGSRCVLFRIHDARIVAEHQPESQQNEGTDHRDDHLAAKSEHLRTLESDTGQHFEPPEITEPVNHGEGEQRQAAIFGGLR